MKLTLVITHYKEPFSVGVPLLDSIKNQINVDWNEDVEVLLVNDGNEVTFSDKELVQYPFVKYLIAPHKGVSGARNYGLDHSTGEYVMFCDFDDRFISMFAIHLIKDAINQQPDVIYGCFMEEIIRPDGEYVLTRRDKDQTFIHGKVFKKSYLEENNIRFDENLTIHEDSYFVCLATNLTENKVEIKVPYYMWCWNPESTVRKDRNLFVMKTYKNVIDCRLALTKALEERGEIDKMLNVIVKTVLDAYYDSNKPDWINPENAELVKSAEAEFRRYYNKYGKDYRECNINRIAEMMYVCRDMAYRNGFRIEQRTVNEWLNHIVNDA